ncbi:MAG: beta-ketoacyl-ACP synthase 3 [Oscillospiraceae bacterium]|nr:beta-ketoacyl-ACP synthase 3 [Oscillospiraceae bacterium]
MQTGIKLISTGAYLPEKIVTNEDLSRIVDTSDEWITKRTGIRTRHHCVSETHLDLAAAAARQALERAGIDKAQLGACVVTTVAGDKVTPSCACMLQAALDLPELTPCFDLNAACAGFPYALRVVQGLLTDERPYGLVVSAEVLSRLLDFTDRSTCVLFGDGAGAAVVARQEGAEDIHAVLGSRGNDQVLCIDGAWADHTAHVHMEGQPVFKFAVNIIPSCIEDILRAAGRTLEEVDLVVMHQANERILDHVVSRMGLPPEKVYKNIAHIGNISSACIPVALNELYEAGRLTPGLRMLCVGFGGGLTWGGCLIEMGGKEA